MVLATTELIRNGQILSVCGCFSKIALQQLSRADRKMKMKQTNKQLQYVEFHF